MPNTSNITFDTQKVKLLESLRAQASDIQKQIDQNSQPQLDDYDLIPKIYEVYQSLFQGRHRYDDSSAVYHRKKFILVILYLYSPRTLVGGKMRIGLRNIIARLFGLSSGTPVSDNCADLMLYYRQCRDFKKDVDTLFGNIKHIIHPKE